MPANPLPPSQRSDDRQAHPSSRSSSRAPSQHLRNNGERVNTRIVYQEPARPAPRDMFDL